MTCRRISIAALTPFVVACHGGPPPAVRPVNPDAHPLAAMVGQPVLIAPVQSVRIAPELAWTGLPKPAAMLASLDSALTDTIRARVANPQWAYADALIQSAKENPTYATDPHSFSIQALKARRLEVAERLPEPLASQLRTMLALHEGRLVLIPVELRFERDSVGITHSVLHLVLVDPRLSDIRWFGDVVGSTLTAFSPAYSAPLAARVADLFVAK